MCERQILNLCNETHEKEKNIAYARIVWFREISMGGYD